jgi:hypothetical protein
LKICWKALVGRVELGCLAKLIGSAVWIGRLDRL